MSPAEVLNKRKETLRDSIDMLPAPKPVQYSEARSAAPEAVQEVMLSSGRVPQSPTVAKPGKLELSYEPSQVLMSEDSLRAEELPDSQAPLISPPAKPSVLQLADS